MRLKHAVTWLVLLLSGSAQAGSRTVQFVGVADASILSLDVMTHGSYTDVAACTIVVANTGSTSQKITSFYSIGIIGTATGGAPQAFYTIDPTTQSVLYDTSGAEGTCKGGETIVSGAFCIIRFEVDVVSLDNYIGICAGKMTIEDVESAQPGSVVASGTVFMSQETTVVGGQLMGAFYDAGPIVSTTGALNASSGTVRDEDDLLWSDYVTSNMNYYCAVACYEESQKRSQTSTWDKNACMRHCGGSYDTDDISTTTRMNLNAFIQVATDDSSGAYANPVPVPPESGANETDIVSSYIRTAHPRFAGGMVHEMIMGPFRSICSGNQEFVTDGGDDFDHTLAADTSLMVKVNELDTSSIYPPEFLACNHMHGKSDLVSSTGSTTPFQINGGLPF